MLEREGHDKDINVTFYSFRKKQEFDLRKKKKNKEKITHLKERKY